MQLYRVIENYWEDYVDLRVISYDVVKSTPKGEWIMADGKRKFILRDTVRCFARPTKEQALASFIKRKEKQIKILSRQLYWTKNALGLALKEDCLDKINTIDNSKIFY